MVTLLRAALLILEVLSWMIIIDVILSYFPSASRNQFAISLRRITHALTDPIRRIIAPKRVGEASVDFSPLVALVIIWVLQAIVTATLARMLPH